jgi:two-component system chemotaxis sensor kinase CheA
MKQSNNPTETFLQEAAELLEQIEANALEIRPGLDCTEHVNHLFRAFHTIKGSGAMFGFSDVAGFTHHVETALDLVRVGRMSTSPELIALLLAARDHIAALLAASQNGKPTDKEAGNIIIEELRALTPAEEKSAASTAPQPPQAPVVEKTEGGMKRFRIAFRPNVNLLTAGTDPRSLLDELRALGECTIAADPTAIPPLDKIQSDGCYLAWTIQLATDKGEAAIRDVFMFVEDGADLRVEEIPESTTSAQSPLPAKPEVARAPVSPAPPTQAATSQPPVPARPAVKDSAATNGKSSSVRVASERLDLLVNLVGELVMTHSRISQVSTAAKIPALDTPVEDLERIVAAIRDAVLGIRMMPIANTFSRFKRLVHDLSAELGKEIDLRITGEETELDKTVLDQLGDPLVHLVRNSIDHAIELPADRERAGKPRHGTIHLSAAHEGSNVIVTITDDGRGLNLAAIRAKAIERKLIAPDAVLSEQETINLIFLPGFSTAEKVTSVSGRGVGMDVVRRQVDALRGTIRITTKAGEGTTVALSLPLTLAIIEGQLVEIDGDQFIIPMSTVAENVEIEASERTTRNGRNLIPVRGELIPYIRLRDLFEIRGQPPEIEKIVIVYHEGQRVGLVVDRVLGSHQTVIQSLGRFYRNIEVASGATIMGDGRVALILDLAGLVRTSGQPLGDRPAPAHT